MTSVSSSQNTPPSSPHAQASLVGLSVLFATLYFVQGISEPTAGLLEQPIRSTLFSWKQSAGQIGWFMGVLGLPWIIKPVYGLLSDFVPLAGRRRKSYLIVASAASMTGLLWLAATPLEHGSPWLLLALLLLPSVGIAVADVVVDALLVEIAQPRGLTGRLQAVQWTAMNVATVLAAKLGGHISANGQARTGFLVCGLFSAATLAMAIFVVHENPVAPASAESRRARSENWQAMWAAFAQALQSRLVLTVGAFLLLWSFNPFSSTVLYHYIVHELGWGEATYGNLKTVEAVAAVVGSLTYGMYCRRVPFRMLVHASVALGVVSTLAYWAMSDLRSAWFVYALVGFSYMTALMIQLDLAARVCPPAIAGTVFALLMSISNLGSSGSEWVGGSWFDWGAGRWGTHTSFNVLVGVGALCTAGCWLIVPWLPKEGSANSEQEPAGHGTA